MISNNFRFELVPGHGAKESPAEAGIGYGVAHERVFALPAEAAHAALDIGQEALAALLTVVDLVDAGVELALDRRARLRKLGGCDTFTHAPAREAGG